MSSRNDDSSTAIGLVAAGLACLAYFVAIAFVFLAFVCTIMSILAWYRPLRLGKIVVEPEEARGFIIRGVAGAVIFPAFLLFLDVALGMKINWQYDAYYVLAGYVGGSLGLGLLLYDENDAGGTSVQVVPPQVPPSLPSSLPRPQPEPFHYASWDDEEMRR